MLADHIAWFVQSERERERESLKSKTFSEEHPVRTAERADDVTYVCPVNDQNSNPANKFQAIKSSARSAFLSVH